MIRGSAGVLALLVVAAALDQLGRAQSLAAPAKTAGPAAASVSVVGSQFRMRLDDGRVLQQEALKGAVLAFGVGSGRQRPAPHRFGGAGSKDGEVMLYSLSEQDLESGQWRNACCPILAEARISWG